MSKTTTETPTKNGPWRGLVAVPAAIRSQWVKETHKFFPEAEVRAFQGKEIREKMEAWLDECGDSPAVVITSYNSVADEENLAVLKGIYWDDLICDEAAILASTSSARTQALWELRDNSGVAVAATGTPINRSIDDVGHLLSWVRNDKTAFHGAKLSKRFDMSDPESVKDFWDAVGPTLFRRDRSEIADQLPKIEMEVISIDPDPAELKLANAARIGLKNIYEALLNKLELAEELAEEVGKSDPKLIQARAELRKVRGAVLGGITVARQAASDPAALKDSESASVALLDSVNVIEPAIKQGGTKRKLIVDLTRDLVDDEQAVLIFTDFSTVAENLADDLKKLGVKAGTFSGKNAGKRRDANAEAFQNGGLDVLILTGAGREGLNLQRANVLIHYDLPWVPSQIIQRVGRASRFGSKNSNLQILVPIMTGTIEERVAAVLVPRAAQAIAALDAPRGVKASETEAGMAVQGLEKIVKSDETNDDSAMAMVGKILADADVVPQIETV